MILEAGGRKGKADSQKDRQKEKDSMCGRMRDKNKVRDRMKKEKKKKRIKVQRGKKNQKKGRQYDFHGFEIIQKQERRERESGSLKVRVR